MYQLKQKSHRAGQRAVTGCEPCASQVLRPAPVRNSQPSRRVVPRALLEGVSAIDASYAVLGLGGLSFVGTFLIAPRFKESFKEDMSWQDMYAELSKRKVQSITPEEAYARARKGAVLLDIRLADKHAASAPRGSVSVPLYQPIQGWDPASNIRRAGFAFFGIFGTERNRSFESDLAASLPSKSKEVVVLCEMGGSMERKEGADTGFQSRSLKAVYAMQQAGYSKVVHMKGGYAEWVRAGLPLQDDDDDEDDSQGGEQVNNPFALAGMFSR